MAIPTAFLVFPPLLLAYPASYILWFWRTLLPRTVKAAKLLSAGTLIDAAQSCTPEGATDLTNSEDLLVWERHQVAIVSSDPGRNTYNAFTGEGDELEAKSGMISTYNLQTRRVDSIDIQGWPPAPGRTLHPLGIGLLEESDGKSALLAICNPAKTRAYIDLIRLHADESSKITASYVSTFEHDLITAPNAVVVLSETQLLFTNSFHFDPRRHKVAFIFEQLAALPLGTVRLLTRQADDTVTCQTVINGIALANGLTLSEDRKMLAVSCTTSHDVYFYDVVTRPGGVWDKDSFTFRKGVPVGLLPDNLHFAPSTGNDANRLLLVAGHPSSLGILKAAATHGKYISASRVVTVRIPRDIPTGTGGIGEVFERLFANIGSGVKLVFESPDSYASGFRYGTSSTAAAFDGGQQMLVCGLWEQGILRCSKVDL